MSKNPPHDNDLSPQDLMEQSYQGAKQSYLIRERRWALLQAAATISAMPVFHNFNYNNIVPAAVDAAEALLAEIEKRETGEGQS